MNLEKARHRGEYAAELYPVVVVENPYVSAAHALAWEEARAHRIVNPTPEYREKCRWMLALLQGADTL